MRHRIALALVLSIIIPCLSGCFGSKELDDWGYAYTIGIDKGISDKLRLTVQLAALKQGSGGGSQQSPSSGKHQSDITVMSVDCPSLSSGAQMLNTSLSRTLNFMHIKYIVISEDLAREGVSASMRAAERNYQIRRTTNIIISKEPAIDFIKGLNPTLGTSLTKTQQLLLEHEEDTGLFNTVPSNEFINDTKSTYKMPSATLAALNDFSHFKESGNPSEGFKSPGDYTAGELPRQGGNDYEFFGTAIFDGDRMVDELNGDESRALLMVEGQFKAGVIVIADPKKPDLRVSVNTFEGKKPEIKVSFADGKPVINVKVFLEGDIISLQSSIEYESENLKPLLEERYRSFIKDMLDRTRKKCQKSGCDIFGFGEIAAMHFLTIPEWEAYHWFEKFKTAEVNTDVEFIIRRTGTIIKTNPSQTVEGPKK